MIEAFPLQGGELPKEALNSLSGSSVHMSLLPTRERNGCGSLSLNPSCWRIGGALFIFMLDILPNFIDGLRMKEPHGPAKERAYGLSE
jgi:hypothetical protein